jgi:hypothetical protein
MTQQRDGRDTKAGDTDTAVGEGAIQQGSRADKAMVLVGVVDKKADGAQPLDPRTGVERWEQGRKVEGNEAQMAQGWGIGVRGSPEEEEGERTRDRGMGAGMILRRSGGMCGEACESRSK